MANLNINYNFNYTKGKNHTPSDNYVYVKNPLLSETEIKGGNKDIIMYADLIHIGQFINFGYNIANGDLKNNFSINFRSFIESLHLHFTNILSRIQALEGTLPDNPVGAGTYYWYAGTTLPSAENLASIAVGSSNSIEQWNGKVFNITNSGSTSTPAYVCTPVDYKVSWKDMNGFTINLVEVEGARFTLNGINYIVQKRGRDLISGATLTVKGYYTN